ncbi:MAG TPA: histidine kinase [Gaiellaceae bacterium]|nr:histidine kinase [Gaiellaceae bacterium]
MDDSLERLVAAEQDERRRLALFLHDGPVQNLSGIALMIDAALHSMENGNIEDARSVLSSALDRQRATIRDLRNLSFGLEPVVLRDRGFGPAIHELALQLGTSYKFRVDLDIEAAEGIGQSAQIALYTIMRELLDQSVRRGPPSRVRIEITRQPDGGVEASVADDAEPERRRRSMEAIEERVKQLHGAIRFEASPGKGTRVVVTLPPYATRR